MRYVLTTHALLQARRRGISRDLLMQVLQGPEQRFPQRQGRHILQPRVMLGSKPWLVRAHRHAVDRLSSGRRDCDQRGAATGAGDRPRRRWPRGVAGNPRCVPRDTRSRSIGLPGNRSLISVSAYRLTALPPYRPTALPPYRLPAASAARVTRDPAPHRTRRDPRTRPTARPGS